MGSGIIDRTADEGRINIEDRVVNIGNVIRPLLALIEVFLPIPIDGL